MAFLVVKVNVINSLPVINIFSKYTDDFKSLLYGFMVGFFQEGSSQSVKSNLSRPASQNSVADVSDSMGMSNSSAQELQNKAEYYESMLPEKNFSGLSNTRNIGSANPSNLPSCVNSGLSSSRPELVARQVCPGLFSLGNGGHYGDNLNPTTLDARNFRPSSIFEIALPRGQLSAESISKSLFQMGISPAQQQQHYGDNSRAENLINNINYVNFVRNNNGGANVSNQMINERMSIPRRTSSTNNLQSQHIASDLAKWEELKVQLQSNNCPSVNISALRNGGYPVDQKTEMIIGS